MKTISNIERLVPQDYWGVADKFRLSYTGRYVSEKTDKEPVDVWEISASMKNLGEFWSTPVRFVVSDGTRPEELARMLEAKDFEVVRITPPTYEDDRVSFIGTLETFRYGSLPNVSGGSELRICSALSLTNRTCPR